MSGVANRARSSCVCTSIKPGATILPDTSSSRAPSALSTLPTATMRSPAIATSARRRGRRRCRRSPRRRARSSPVISRPLRSVLRPVIPRPLPAHLLSQDTRRAIPPKRRGRNLAPAHHRTAPPSARFSRRTAVPVRHYRTGRIPLPRHSRVGARMAERDRSASTCSGSMPISISLRRTSTRTAAKASGAARSTAAVEFGSLGLGRHPRQAAITPARHRALPIAASAVRNRWFRPPGRRSQRPAPTLPPRTG